MSLGEVRQKIEAACKSAGRKASDVTLVAVSKSQTLDKIIPMLDAGHRIFGENRVQEAMERWPPLAEKYPGVKLHFIGHLQTNKAKEAVKLFDVIETVDSERLAASLAEEMRKQSKKLPCFLQVNTGEEPQKGGIAPRDLEKLLRFCRKDAGLGITGLMCIPPEGDIPDLHFALLHKLAASLDLKALSMGMSSDYEIAIRYGATHIRVGSALFGVRENQ